MFMRGISLAMKNGGNWSFHPGRLDLFFFHPIFLLYIVASFAEPLLLLGLKVRVIIMRRAKENKSQVFYIALLRCYFLGKVSGPFLGGLTSTFVVAVPFLFRLKSKWLKRLATSWQTMSHKVHRFDAGAWKRFRRSTFLRRRFLDSCNLNMREICYINRHLQSDPPFSAFFFIR